MILTRLPRTPPQPGEPFYREYRVRQRSRLARRIVCAIIAALIIWTVIWIKFFNGFNPPTITLSQLVVTLTVE